MRNRKKSNVFDFILLLDPNKQKKQKKVIIH